MKKSALSVQTILSVLCIAAAVALVGCGKKEVFESAKTESAPFIVSSQPASLTACPAGGTVFKTFSDTNRNGILDSNEDVIASSVLCNGVAGITSDILARLAALEAALNLNFTQDALLNARMSTVEARILALESSVSGLQSTIASNQATLQSEINTLSQTDVNLANQITSLFASINSLTNNSASASALAALANTVSQIQSSLTTTNSNVTNIQAAIATLTAQVANLQAGQASLNSSITSLTTQIASITNNVSILANQTNQNTAGIALLASQLSALTTTVNNLSTTVINLQNSTSGSGSMATQIAQIAALQVQMATANSNIAALQTLIAQLQNKTVEIVNTCGNEKLQRINGKLYGVYHTVTTATVPVAKIGSSTVAVASCTTTNSHSGCIGGMDQVLVNVPTSGTITYINSVASYFAEIPNGTYLTTDTNNNAGGTGCQFSVLNGQVSF